MKQLTFPNTGQTFSAVRDAEKYLENKGYRIGSMCGNAPIGFADADKYDYVSKWWNMDDEDRKKLAGKMESKDWREGEVTVEIY